MGSGESCNMKPECMQNKYLNIVVKDDQMILKQYNYAVQADCI